MPSTFEWFVATSFYQRFLFYFCGIYSTLSPKSLENHNRQQPRPSGQGCFFLFRRSQYTAFLHHDVFLSDGSAPSGFAFLLPLYRLASAFSGSLGRNFLAISYDGEPYRVRCYSSENSRLLPNRSSILAISFCLCSFILCTQVFIANDTKCCLKEFCSLFPFPGL